jgi:tripartite-type tricarboxylate transporter receptor subunit TctC
MRAVLFSLLAAVGLALGASTASAQDYPVRPIRIVLPFAPGGAVDIISRMLGEKMTMAWGQPVIVDGKRGAGGIIAANAVAKSAGDGYTLLMTTANLTINPSLHKDLPYDTQRDLVPVVPMIGIPNVIVVRADLPAHNLAELIALAKREPGKLNYASPGTGTFPHLAFELFMRLEHGSRGREHVDARAGTTFARAGTGDNITTFRTICRCDAPSPDRASTASL